MCVEMQTDTCHANFQQEACVKKLSGKAKLEDSKATKQIVSLLSAPLDKYNDIVTALKLSNYPRVMDHLDNGTKKVMAVVIIQSIIKNNTCVSTADKVGLYSHAQDVHIGEFLVDHNIGFFYKVEALFELINGLIKDTDGILVDEVSVQYDID